MPSIYHVVPHLGGGVGRVLMNLIHESCKNKNNEFDHYIICFENANNSAIQWGKRTGIKIWHNILPANPQLDFLLSKADIVHIHFWNHPLIYRFFTNQNLPEFRTVIWSHVNGHEAPQKITKNVLDYPDIFVFSTKYSEDILPLKAFDNRRETKRLRTIFVSSGFEHVKDVIRIPHEGFNIGYIGTVEYCKIHRHFIKICNSVNIPDVKFIVCGGNDHEQLKYEAKSSKAHNIFEIKGPVKDICSELAVFDLFGYPLAKGHYGTGEQALIEAMSIGVVPVVLDNGPERHIIRHNYTGIVAGTETEYIAALEYLYHHPDQREKLSCNAKQYASEYYDITKTVDAWYEIYCELMTIPKSSHSFVGMEEYSPNTDIGTKLFILSLGDSYEAKVYRHALETANIESFSTRKVVLEELASLPPIFYSASRGSVYHYYSYWQESKGLKYLCYITKEAEKYKKGNIDENEKSFLSKLSIM